MPAERLPMRQVREVLRLKHICGQSGHGIAAAIGVSRYTVAEYLRRAAVVGITWPVPPELDDTALERKLFTPPGAMAAEALRPQPDWVRIHAETRRAGVTLLLLWEEYRSGQPDGYGYSRFCDLYAAWRGRLSPTMRQSHPLGERLFVDYAGQTVEVIDAITGEVRTAQIFVAALGASNLTYAEARWTQGLADWIGCHVNAFAFLGCHASGGVRQPQGGRHRGLSLRTRHQPQLCRHGDALRHRHRADAGAQTTRQGKGRGRGSTRTALGAGTAAASTVLPPISGVTCWRSSTTGMAAPQPWSPANCRSRIGTSTSASDHCRCSARPPGPHAHRIELKGESLRKLRAVKAVRLDETAGS
jgi:transposase